MLSGRLGDHEISAIFVRATFQRGDRPSFPTLARKSQRLQEFHVTVVYKPGRKHSDAECLSRAPAAQTSTDTDDDGGFLDAITPTALAQEQREDIELGPLIDYLEGRTPRLAQIFARNRVAFCLFNNVLNKKNFGPSEKTYLLVAPKTLREKILHASYDEPTSGHFGFSRTLASIRYKYYWPKLSESMKRYVRTCRDCQRRKTPPTKPA